MSKSVAIIGTRGYPSYYGGFETAIRHIAPYLADKGWEVTVYGRPRATKVDDPDLDSRITARTTWGHESKSLSTLTYGLSSTLDAARRQPDVALVMNVANGFWLPLLRMRRIPTLINVDGIEWDREKWGKLAKATFRGGARATVRYGDTLIFDAEEIRHRWALEYEVDGVVIPYGGDAPALLPLEPGLKHRRYVLVVARFVPENTIPQFLVAAETLAKTHDVVVVGSSGYGGELDGRVATLAAANERVHWFGHIHDDRRLHSLWQHAGVYFHGHSVGGTNPALVQAMACGAPVVARDTVYNREVLSTAGEFTSPRPDAIVATIGALLNDPARQHEHSWNAHVRAATAYSWGSVCAAYEANLSALLGERVAH